MPSRLGMAGDRAAGSTDLRDLPKVLWAGLVIGVLGFFVSFGGTSREVVNGVQTSCSTFDLAALIIAIFCVACVPAAVVDRRRTHRKRRSAAWLIVVAGIVLVGLAAIHVLRAFGTVGGACH